MKFKFSLLIVIVVFFASCVSSQYGNYGKKNSFFIKQEIDTYDLNLADTLLDVGAGIGLFDLEISHHHPNIFLVLEDLPLKRNFSKGHPKVYDVLRNSKYTPFIEGQFTFISGKTDSIPLNSNSFKKIVCRLTFHEFENKSEMVGELFRVLKPEGELIIVEREPKFLGEKDKGCKREYLTKIEILNSFDSFLFKRSQSVSYGNDVMNILVFSK